MKVAKSRYFQKRSAGSGKSGRHRERTMSSLEARGERETQGDREKESVQLV